MATARHARRSKRLGWGLFLAGVVVGISTLAGLHQLMSFTSTDRFCESCHSHPEAIESWEQSSHYRNPSGVITHCVDCHLPPSGWALWREKVRLGVRDVYGKLFKDPSKIDWQTRSRLAHAVR